jgi:hypothetical protein
VFRACDIIQLFSVVFCMVKAVHRFDFKFAINKTTNDDQWKGGHGVMEIQYIHIYIYFFFF